MKMSDAMMNVKTTKVDKHRGCLPSFRIGEVGILSLAESRQDK